MDRPSFFDSSREHFIFTLFPTMPLSVSDRVKSSAVLYDQGTEDENGLTFSQRQLAKGLHGACPIKNSIEEEFQYRQSM